MLHLLQFVFLGLCLAGCQTSNLSSSTRIDSIRFVGVDTNKWIAENQDTPSASLTVYGCKPSICPKGTAVSYLVMDSILAQYGSKVILKTFTDARVDLEQEGAVFSINNPVRIKGFMAFNREYYKNSHGNLKFLSSSIIFTNNTQVVVSAASSNAKSARKYRDEFVSKLQIKDGGSAAQ